MVTMKDMAVMELLQTAESLTAPAYLQESTYGHVIAKTIMEMNKVSNPPQRSQSLLEQLFQSSNAENQSLLQSVFSTKGAIVYNKT
ncbi:hypothetical protein LJC46_09445 [Desulfovibrio sp. OttesenSCG-928-G15]|nr:hypothetical protein [Desulfovibrio sp. OttesenSCG-928-G15]